MVDLLNVEVASRSGAQATVVWHVNLAALERVGSSWTSMTELESLGLQGGFLTLGPPGKPLIHTVFY